jgi:hypothetical protein
MYLPFFFQQYALASGEKQLLGLKVAVRPFDLMTEHSLLL